MSVLSPKQKKILDFIADWQRSKPYSPSIRDIGKHFGINVSSTAQHLQALESKGALQRDGSRSRALRLKGDAGAARHSFKLLGTIPAGSPFAAAEIEDESLLVEPNWFGSGEMIALRVMGDSMSGDAICDGDVAIIRLQKQHSAQDIVAVRIAYGEATLKRLRIEKDIAYLLSSNPAHPVRSTGAADVEIVGVLKGIIRRQ